MPGWVLEGFGDMFWHALCCASRFIAHCFNSCSDSAFAFTYAFPSFLLVRRSVNHTWNKKSIPLGVLVNQNFERCFILKVIAVHRPRTTDYRSYRNDYRIDRIELRTAPFFSGRGNSRPLPPTRKRLRRYAYGPDRNEF